MPARKREPRTQPRYYTIQEVCVILGRGKVIDLIRHERLPVEKFGMALRIPIEGFEQWLAQRATAPVKPAKEELNDDHRIFQ